MSDMDSACLAARPVKFARFFSTDSPKAIKANEFGWLNAINYMAPHTLGGAGNLCPHASPACMALCLGWFSGQAGIAKDGSINSVRDSRIRKALFMHDRADYMREMLLRIAKLVRRARKLKLKLAVRPNGSTDIAYESMRVMVDPAFAATLSRISGHAVPHGPQTIFTAFPKVRFVDYTKNPKRFDRALPANYSLTFSLSETNKADALQLLARGHNVAAIFAEVPRQWEGYRVINGDKHDLRHLDPKGVVVGLLPKGTKARRDSSGMVVR